MPQMDIPLAQLVVSPLNSRRDQSAGQEDSGIGELAADIKRHGLLNPLTVRPIANGQFEIVAGQRRFWACKQADFSPVPCNVLYDLDDASAEALSLVENVQRADLNPLDKARALKTLYERHGSYDKVSREVSLSTATIRKYVQLLSLPVDLQRKIGTKEGAAGVGALSKLASAFEGDAAIEAYNKISGFQRGIQEEIIQRSKGDLSRLDDLVEEAHEGAFNVRRCGGRVGCEIVRDIIEGEITRSEFEQLVSDIRNSLGLQSMPRRQKTATNDFWKALAKR
jgi:ParB family chromosome partitioning protein